jgi:hypothetical protein
MLAELSLQPPLLRPDRKTSRGKCLLHADATLLDRSLVPLGTVRRNDVKCTFIVNQAPTSDMGGCPRFFACADRLDGMVLPIISQACSVSSTQASS